MWTCTLEFQWEIGDGHEVDREDKVDAQLFEVRGHRPGPDHACVQLERQRERQLGRDDSARGERYTGRHGPAHSGGVYHQRLRGRVRLRWWRAVQPVSLSASVSDSLLRQERHVLRNRIR